ncbi:hypothetical protein OC842_006540 [Tilletia horrida]|uniref:FAD-binding PCMH-type domain-containing protein n=1 Tax=Tilletia horrida TaxID=155126 RepID=A0AAN6G8C9_9BASI|nr:hypothetical protein OC842_006540 [Tilletia horrida]
MALSARAPVQRRPHRALLVLAAALLLCAVLAQAAAVGSSSPPPASRGAAAEAVSRSRSTSPSSPAARFAEWSGPPPPYSRRFFDRQQEREREREQDESPGNRRSTQQLQSEQQHLNALKRASEAYRRQTPHLAAAELPPAEVPELIKSSSNLVSCIYNLGIKIVTPTQQEFWNSAQSDNLNYHYLPLAVAYPNSTRTVSDCVRCAAKHGNVPVSARSGGHSFSGSGSGGQDGALVIDMGGLSFIELDDHGLHDAFVGPGARLGEVVKALWQKGKRAMTHGTCPTVGVGGHALCGGFGPLSRAWGLAADAILHLDVILADGSFALVNPVEHRDLLWGMRGAGNHFGIVTRFTFRTQDVADKNMTYIEHTWRENVPTQREFAKLLDGLTAWSSRKDLPSELGYHLQITPSQSAKTGNPLVQIHLRANYIGPKAAAEMVFSTLWPELRSRGGETLATPDGGSRLQEMNWLETMSEWDDFGEPGDKLNTAKERLEHNNYVPKTTLIRTNPAAPASAGPSVGARVPLETWEAWAKVFYEGTQHGVGANKWSWNVFMELFGGHNAFHLKKQVRDLSSIPFVDGMWLVQQTVGTWPGAVVDSEGKRFVRRLHEALNSALDAARITKSSYGCYQDPDRADWLEAFHGTGVARDRLFTLKDRYDPTNLFRNGQSLGSKAEREAKKKAKEAATLSKGGVTTGGQADYSHDIHPLPR